jgi:tRNA-splicing ligase RtcB
MRELKLEKINDITYKIHKTGNMLVDGIIYASEKIMPDVTKDESLQQVANVACLPGIIKYSIAMPDIHWGYGFPIGGVAAFGIDDGVVSPGGVGYDINCGVRLLSCDLKYIEVKDKIKALIDTLFQNVPSGVGSKRKDLKLTQSDEKIICQKGVEWAIQNGFGTAEDLEHIEENGKISGGDISQVGERAQERGRVQLGTLGSGNHFIEIDRIAEIYDEKIASVMNLRKDYIAVFIHTGSRGFGYQICDDYIKIMNNATQKYGFNIPDRQLCCAPIKSEEGVRYMSAMAAACNFAFTNRQLITHWVRQTFYNVLDISPKMANIELIYDVAHNIAKIEEHVIDGKKQKVCVHRKGATRAFGPGHPDIPLKYKEIGQPVLIPGDMGRYSFVLVGTKKAEETTFGSTCHGAGRMLSRHQATKHARGRSIEREMSARGIYLTAGDRRTIVEEIPEAYKDVEDVVNIVHDAQLSKKVARLVPIGVIKG